MFRYMGPSSGMNVCNLKLSGIYYKNIVICTEDCFPNTHSLYPAAQTPFINHQFLKLPLDLRILIHHFKLNRPNWSPMPHKMQGLQSTQQEHYFHFCKCLTSHSDFVHKLFPVLLVSCLCRRLFEWTYLIKSYTLVTSVCTNSIENRNSAFLPQCIILCDV